MLRTLAAIFTGFFFSSENLGNVQHCAISWTVGWCGILPMCYEHAFRAGSYETTHRDPFDRMLAAQSEVEKLPLVSRDQSMKAFSCNTIW